MNMDSVCKWRSWSIRKEQQPIFYQTENALSIECTGRYDYGKWLADIPCVPGESYQFSVRYRIDDLFEGQDHINNPIDYNVRVMLSWLKPDGTWHTRDYVCDEAHSDGYITLSRTQTAPEGATAVCVELGYCYAQGTKITFSDWNFESCKPLGKRNVRLCALHIIPGEIADKTHDGILKEVLSAVDVAGRENPDAIVLSETINDRAMYGTPIKERCVPIPCTFTDELGSKAREYNTYIIASLHESDGDMMYTTAVLIDRKGCIAGKYRKTHLALNDAECGISPGEELPVFDTDFGRIGMLICWDVFFPDPSKIMAQKGAEVLFVSTAGDAPAQSVARAIDNGVYVVTAGIGKADDTAMLPTRIISPGGAVLCQTREHKHAVFADVDLNKRLYTYWLSVGEAFADSKSVFLKESRCDSVFHKASRFNTNT